MEPIYVSSDSSDEEKNRENSVSKALEEAKEFIQKNPRTKIMEDTMKRLANFANTVEQIHEEQSEEKDSDNEQEKNGIASEENSENETKTKKKSRQSTLVSSIKKSNRNTSSRSTTPEKVVTIAPSSSATRNPVEDDDPIEPLVEDEDIHKDNCVKMVSEIYRFFEGRFPKIAIIIALHKNCGKIYEAMKSLENGEVDKDPKLLVDPSIVKGSEEDKRNYFCN